MGWNEMVHPNVSIVDDGAGVIARMGLSTLEFALSAPVYKLSY